MQEQTVKIRQKILESAVAVFAEKGFSGATVDAIAETAAGNRQRIPACFNSRQGLLEAARLHCFGEVELFSHGTLRRIAAGPERMTEFQPGGSLAAHERNPRFRRLLSGTNLEGDGDPAPPDLTVSLFYFSNRGTLIHTIDGELFADGGAGMPGEQLGELIRP